MKLLFANLALAGLWIVLTRQPSGWNFCLGFAVGYFALRLTSRRRPPPGYYRKVPQALGFAAFFLKELVVSSLRVAHDIVTPRIHMRPAILGVPLDAKTDAEITLLACLVTLTPGTLTLDVSDDRRTLFVHAMFVDDAGRSIAAIKDGFERRLLVLMR